ncbi:unnamed protein product [Lactuca virosa]|uniref:RRM domain-containing protein n=1 Tax=Lactuca virosa TaxID=75947 RepID=A0AAU9N5V2_9ASTR|nr:unnamed protein product [Lactuca virosa]
MLPNSGEWTEVWQRKTTATHNNNVNVTKFYVAGFPRGIRKVELWKPFAKFGQVVDVYLRGKKDFKGMNFAFIRYIGIENRKALEERLQGTKCRDVALHINLSRPTRKPIHAQQKGHRHQHRDMMLPQPPICVTTARFLK